VNEIINPLLLSTAILLTPELASGDDTAAIKAFMKATYVQTGMNKQVKVLEKTYVNDDMRAYGGWAF
jgi:hypothetical protein